jgi:hypothetical protein
MANLQVTHGMWNHLGRGSADGSTGLDQDASHMDIVSPLQVTHNLTPKHS